jgi:histidyl-tRNA synthetase
VGEGLERKRPAGGVAEAPTVNRPRGTRDFGPAETHVRAHVGARIQQVFRRFGYREVQTPTFEELALFTAKSGEGVIGELYDFKDKGGREMCLRPELTAPVMRMYFQDRFNEPKPLKWFYFGNCFRYDRPQAGRYREFWQFGCEQIGAGTPLAYAELLALADAVMANVGLREREFFVGHVKLLKHCVDAFGFDAEARGKLMRAIDKGDRAEVQRLADAKGGCAAAVDRLFLVIDAHTTAAARNALQLDLTAQTEADAELRADLADLESCLAHLGSFGVRGVQLNLGIARGLDYYTGIVFEMHCPILGAEKQLLGGGGYDLSRVFGGTATPTMGFGLGFDRTIVALERQAELAGQALAFPRDAGPALYVAALSEAATKRVLPIVSQLRARGVEVELDLLGRKPGAVAKHADAVGARRLAIVGDRDLESGAVQVKELASGNAETVRLDALATRDWT